jgi:hypothetical protein
MIPLTFWAFPFDENKRNNKVAIELAFKGEYFFIIKSVNIRANSYFF